MFANVNVIPSIIWHCRVFDFVFVSQNHWHSRTFSPSFRSLSNCCSSFLSLIRWIYKNVSCEIIVPHLFSLNIMLCVGDDPLLCMTALLLAWCVFVRRMVDMKLVSHAPAADDMPNRWWGCCNGLQHKYRWKCCRNTPDTQYNATGFTHEFRKLTTKWIEQREHF